MEEKANNATQKENRKHFTNNINHNLHHQKYSRKAPNLSIEKGKFELRREISLPNINYKKSMKFDVTIYNEK